MDRADVVVDGLRERLPERPDARELAIHLRFDGEEPLLVGERARDRVLARRPCHLARVGAEVIEQGEPSHDVVRSLVAETRGVQRNCRCDAAQRDDQSNSGVTDEQTSDQRELCWGHTEEDGTGRTLFTVANPPKVRMGCASTVLHSERVSAVPGMVVNTSCRSTSSD